MRVVSLQPLARDTVALVEIDTNLLAKHIQIKNILRISERRILTKVAWRRLNLETRLFEAGLRFIDTSKRGAYESFTACTLAI